MATTHLKIAAIKRLLHDLQEVLEEKLPNIVARPMEENLFVWHGNVRGSEGPFLDVPIHFTLTFPQTYPMHPPQCHLATGVPHPNVRLTGAGYRLALWDCIPEYNAWTSAYTVQSILVQLQQFLLADELQYNDRLITVEQAVKNALELKINQVNHTGMNPWPTFPTEQELEDCRKNFRRLRVKVPQIPMRRHNNKRQHSPSTQRLGYIPETSSRNNQEQEWQQVTKKKSSKQQPTIARLQAKQLPLQVKLTTTNRFDQLVTSDEDIVTHNQFPNYVAYRKNTDGNPSSSKQSTNIKTKEQNIQKKQQAQKLTQMIKNQFQQQKQPNVQQVQIQPESQNNQQNPLEQSHKHLIQSTVQKFEEEVRNEGNTSNVAFPDEYPSISSTQQKAMGYLGQLSIQNLVSIMCQLKPKDISKLAMTYSGLNSLSQSGEIWQYLLKTHYPGSKLSATHVSEYKHMFMLELNNVVGELTCFYTKRGLYQGGEDEGDVVLGLPYRYTVNPKTKQVDYIEVDSELMSMDAFYECGVKHNIRGEEIQGVLPLYLTREHFLRAIKYFPKVLRQLGPPEQGGRTPGPQAWLQVLPKIMNTSAVLLCDRGISVTEKSLITYNYLQRLLIGICEHYGLWLYIDAILTPTLRSQQGRHKDNMPNMGNVLPLLGVSKRYSWKDCAQPYLSESFDRSVLWICKNDLSLIEKFKVDPKNTDTDEEFNQNAFARSIVARRLLMFHVAFLHFVAKPQGLSMLDVTQRQDSLYGRPSRTQIAQFNKAVQMVINVNSFQGFFRLLGLRDVSPATVTRQLRQSWCNSLKKGYHRNDTRFDRIQASGVSKIILKGQTYTAPPNMRKIRMDERWSWNGPATKFLDASCLLVDKQCKLIEAIDYSHMWSHGIGDKSAVRHSGDIIEDGKGLHTIQINLEKIPDTIANIYIVMSSWQGVKLNQIKQPFVSLVDPAVPQLSLCDYYLEDMKPDVARQNSSVVMCRIYKRGDNRWNLEAIGKVGLGFAGYYGPIMDTIKDLPHNLA
eukprot:TRINITY_DN1659_c0_g1_i2.p1 TRINITY_DN1659_c0_g1~~TRINITY_DN1659_c0_g1_i2.p1  ORF type:complete len:1082 (+),score=76.95 TRINITY_DN1659_c0_g1_i2:206-3247(+)